MKQATLRTARITLVPLADEHLPYEVELDADPEVMRYLGSGRPRTAAQVGEHHRHRMAEATAAPGQGFWVGFVDGAFVGWWVLGPPEREEQIGPGQAELGYRIVRRYWRQGLASEGARELVRHGFEDLGFARILAETMAVNAGSRATMEAVGLSYSRTFRQHVDEPIAGIEHGEVEYAITRAAWLAARGAGPQG